MNPHPGHSAPNGWRTPKHPVSVAHGHRLVPAPLRWSRRRSPSTIHRLTESALPPEPAVVTTMATTTQPTATTTPRILVKPRPRTAARAKQDLSTSSEAPRPAPETCGTPDRSCGTGLRGPAFANLHVCRAVGRTTSGPRSPRASQLARSRTPAFRRLAAHNRAQGLSHAFCAAMNAGDCGLIRPGMLYPPPGRGSG